MLVSASAVTLGKLVPAAVPATTAIRFATTGGYQLTAGSAWEHAAGIIGLILLAIYAALAMALEDVARRTRLPLGRRGAGYGSLAGGLEEQLESIEHEAGIREQL